MKPCKQGQINELESSVSVSVDLVISLVSLYMRKMLRFVTNLSSLYLLQLKCIVVLLLLLLLLTRSELQ